MSHKQLLLNLQNILPDHLDIGWRHYRAIHVPDDYSNASGWSLFILETTSRMVTDKHGDFSVYTKPRDPRSLWRPSRTGGFTEAFIYTVYDRDNVVGYGTATCSRDDNFSYEEGRTWATERAVKALINNLWGPVLQNPT